ncbi:MAG TPA: hypothetical protein DCG69_05475 [Bacteroidales bacterium]|nr:hypothetical protein [Bacteroidales bacterium]
MSPTPFLNVDFFEKYKKISKHKNSKKIQTYQQFLYSKKNKIHIFSIKQLSEHTILLITKKTYH